MISISQELAHYVVETNHVDAQFNVAYALAVVAHRIDLRDWQKLDTMKDENILAFMNKVKYSAHPNFAETRLMHPRSTRGKIEVTANGGTFSEERVYPKGIPSTDVKATEEDLIKHEANQPGITPSQW